MEFQITEKALPVTATAIIKHLSDGRSDATATVVGLSGNLGAGKTTLTKSCAEVLGISPDEITSPTFVIAKFYDLTNQPWKRFIHIDAYRLEKGEELEKLGFSEYASDPGNLIFIEWPENVSEILPSDRVTLEFSVIDEETRRIQVV